MGHSGATNKKTKVLPNVGEVCGAARGQSPAERRHLAEEVDALRLVSLEAAIAQGCVTIVEICPPADTWGR